MTDDTDAETLEQLVEYLRLNPDATAAGVLGATDADGCTTLDCTADQDHAPADSEVTVPL